jgi:hypothetical protein
MVGASAGYLIGSANGHVSLSTTTLHPDTIISTTILQRTATLTLVSTTTITSDRVFLTSQGPIAIFPSKYLPQCPNSNLTAGGWQYYNSTFLFTRISNYTLQGIESWHTNLNSSYGSITESQSFQMADQGRFWVVAYWEYFQLNGRPVLSSLFILPNSNGTIYGYISPVYYYLDNSQISATFTTQLTTSCPPG